MAVYSFKNQDTGEIREVYIPITGDVSTYNGEDGSETGIWKRTFENYNVYTAIDTKIDPFSQKSFSTATNKKMTIGEMMDLSEEMSRERAAKNDGVDPVKENFYAEYKKRNGVEHPEKKKELVKKESERRFKKLGWDIEVDTSGNS